MSPTTLEYQSHALVVGIKHYRAPFSHLDGALNDARYFSEWLQNGGGGVQHGNVQELLSDSSSSKPVKRMVESALTPFIGEFIQRRVSGKRLYLYFSGHGVEPIDILEDINVLVLMANAEHSRYDGRSVAPLRAARFFQKCAIFDEVVMFADCCRTANLDCIEAAFTFEKFLTELKKYTTGKLLYGFATGHGQDAHEGNLPDNNGNGAVPRGVFTYALLEALRCAADPSNPTRVTGASLSDYLRYSLLKLNYRGVPRVLGDLDIDLGPVLVPTVSVAISVSGPPRPIEVRHGMNLLVPMKSPVVQRGPSAYSVDLPRGMYLIGFADERGRLEGAKQVDLVGDGPFHVAL